LEVEEVFRVGVVVDGDDPEAAVEVVGIGAGGALSFDEAWEVLEWLGVARSGSESRV
jgi:hypothetical protein